MLPYFVEISKKNKDIRNNYFRYRKTFFLISKILVFFLDISKYYFGYQKKTVLDIQNKVSVQWYFGYPKYLFLISKIISDIQKKRLFRISQIVAHLKLEMLSIRCFTWISRKVI